MNMNASKRYLLGGGVVAVILIGFTVGAIRPSKHAQAAPTTVPDIEVVQVQQQDVPIVHEWIGTFDGLVNADVRAQVTGYLLKQGYEEGAFVKKGQLLFQIDPRPFRAVLDQTGGQLAIEDGLSPKAAALKAMEEFSGPVVGIALVFSGKCWEPSTRHSPGSIFPMVATSRIWVSTSFCGAVASTSLQLTESMTRR
jgi:hypothetical protein